MVGLGLDSRTGNSFLGPKILNPVPDVIRRHENENVQVHSSKMSAIKLLRMTSIY